MSNPAEEETKVSSFCNTETSRSQQEIIESLIPEGQQHTLDYYIQSLDACQSQLKLLDERCKEETTKIQTKFEKSKKHLFAKRTKMIKKVTNFYLLSFVNHPFLTNLINEVEVDCMNYLTNLEVENLDDSICGPRIKFHFSPNPYFDNDVITKKYDFNTWRSTSTPIRWKEGKNIIKMIKERQERKQGKKTFFTWFDDCSKRVNDEIGEVIKDDLWLNPVQYFKESSARDVDCKLENFSPQEYYGLKRSLSDTSCANGFLIKNMTEYEDDEDMDRKEDIEQNSKRFKQEEQYQLSETTLKQEETLEKLEPSDEVTIIKHEETIVKHEETIVKHEETLVKLEELSQPYETTEEQEKTDQETDETAKQQ
ncbi:protein SET-like [Macrosteles quadrilineatus]|uniref:protein SET-like n=1 Tax=Macrosteles quadrilineatus TaxID=74068 RepID=UPI0023E0BA17|nr:protein SET-like [Macrosteles quadrilineatus]